MSFVITSYSIHYTKLYDDIRNGLQQNKIEGAVVQYYGSSKDVVIRVAPKGDLTQQTITNAVQKSASAIDPAMTVSRVEYVGPSVGEELTNQGFLARITSYNVCYTKLLRNC